MLHGWSDARVVGQSQGCRSVWEEENTGAVEGRRWGIERANTGEYFIQKLTGTMPVVEWQGLPHPAKLRIPAQHVRPLGRRGHQDRRLHQQS